MIGAIRSGSLKRGVIPNEEELTKTLNLLDIINNRKHSVTPF